MTTHREAFLNNTACIDFETTDIDQDLAEIIEQGITVYRNYGWDIACSQLHNCEAASVRPEASAVNNITKDMIKDFPVFDMMQFGVFHITPHRNIFVSHNASYDSKVFEKYVDPETFTALNDRWLCSYRMMKKLHINEPEFSALNLPYLRYRLNFEVEVETEPHRAGYDSYINGLLLEYILDVMEEREIIDVNEPYFPQIKEWLRDPIILKYFPFGKYNGREIEEIKAIDYGYLKWVFEKTGRCDETSPEYDVDMTATLATIFGPYYNE